MNGLRIAENPVRLRHDRNVTQKELADFMGVTKASVSKWESGRRLCGDHHEGRRGYRRLCGLWPFASHPGQTGCGNCREVLQKGH